ncbi:hypothetical protein BDN70DRAFT_550724 [Pholiota conissans]|uniref:Uncharacterized protein n=1 Tax=Pholiota conissans TaxID=109636 RepID=A0A9P5YMJ0_9AGAR|nr:hypothetical protein BDN70DRAFT_550724 [Pholiota conissans]
MDVRTAPSQMMSRLYRRFSIKMRVDEMKKRKTENVHFRSMQVGLEILLGLSTRTPQPSIFIPFSAFVFVSLISTKWINSCVPIRCNLGETAHQPRSVKE